MPDAVLNDISHRRYNPLRGSWILVSPHRTKRPWQGQQESKDEIKLPAHDPQCYLCPGNMRAQGDQNPQYEGTFVFVNDYSAVKEEQAAYVPGVSGIENASSSLLRAEPVTGKCYVLTFAPQHNLTLADLASEQILDIIDAWTQIYCVHMSPHFVSAQGLTRSASASASPSSSSPLLAIPPPKAQYRYMQIFENKGSAMGCSNPHPHGQIWTTSSLPEEASLELSKQLEYRSQHNGAHMLEDYAALEIATGERVVFSNQTFLAVCPWWATWPFEILVLARTHRRALVDLSAEEKAHLAEVLADVTRRYDNLFETSFPYSMGVHQAPLDGSEEEINASWLHVHFYPPLLRSATVRKFLVGYEMLAEPQRDITPEQAALRLRACGGPLYRSRAQEAGKETGLVLG